MVNIWSNIIPQVFFLWYCLAKLYTILVLTKKFSSLLVRFLQLTDAQTFTKSELTHQNCVQTLLRLLFFYRCVF